MKILNPPKFSLSGFLIGCFICLTASFSNAALPVPWTNQEVGPAVSSSADYANNQFTLNARGIDITSTSISDVFDFVHQPYAGDVELIAKVESFGTTTTSPKAGIMMRENFNMGSKNVFIGLTKGAASTFQKRTTENFSTTSTNGAVINPPYWLKLVRRGNNFSGYQSANGTSWTQLGTTVSVTMASSVYVGLAFTSKQNSTTNNAVFSNVSVRSATPPSAPVLNTVTAGVAQVDLTWNMVDRATSYKVKYGTASGSYTTTLTLGNVASTSVTGLNNGTPYYFVVTALNEYGESVPSNQMSTTPLDPPTVFIKKIDYNAMGQKTRIEYGNGVVTTNTYDPLNLRLKRIYTVNASAVVLQDLSYTYDSAGNILSINDALNTASQSFQYDALNRLTQAVGSTYGTKNYQYDPIGNIVQKDGKIYSYAEGGAGVHAVTSLSDGTTMTYDANGNMASKQKGTDLTLFTYDTENRLTQIKKNNVVTASYEYDGDGGRVKKTVGSTVTRYVGSLYEETNGVKTRHVFVGDMKVASITGAQQMYYLTDHLGGTNVITDKTGVKKEVMEYEPFGTFSRHDKYGTGQEVANFYFTGQRFDEESGLYYYNARYYDPSLGRFITADSIVQDPTDSQTLNRYSYTGNNPVNRIDVDGHKWSWKSFFSSLIGAIVGVATAIVLGPAVGAAAAGAIGGALGGATSAAISGGNILQGALFGGALGGVGGWAAGLDNALGNAILGGMLLGGVGVAAANDSWDSLAGGLVGGVVGNGVGNYLKNISTTATKADNYEHLSSDESIQQKDITDLLNNPRLKPAERAGIIDKFVDFNNAPYEPGLISTWDEMFLPNIFAAGAGLAAKGAGILGKGLYNSVSQFSLKLGNAGFARIGKGISVFQLNKLVNQSSIVPKTILRFDGGKEMLHVHFSDKTALYANGTWKHGFRELTNKERNFLVNEAGFQLK